MDILHAFFVYVFAINLVNIAQLHNSKLIGGIELQCVGLCINTQNMTLK